MSGEFPGDDPFDWRKVPDTPKPMTPPPSEPTTGEQILQHEHPADFVCSLARRIDAAIAERSSEREVMLDDLSALLRALGFGDHARPISPHEVMQDCIRAVRETVARDIAARTRAEAAEQREREAGAKLEAMKTDGRYLPFHAVMWNVVNDQVCRVQHPVGTPCSFEPLAAIRSDPAPAPEATHRCKICHARWRLNPPTKEQPEGSWSLVYPSRAYICCDNVAMGDQIEELMPGCTQAPATLPQERIVAAAIQIGDNVFTGPHHATIIHYVSACTGMKPVKGEQGFVTGTGRFVSRKLAVEIAIAAKQVDPSHVSKEGLMSEDLWIIPEETHRLKEALKQIANTSCGIPGHSVAVGCKAASIARTAVYPQADSPAQANPHCEKQAWTATGSLVQCKLSVMHHEGKPCIFDVSMALPVINN